MVGKRGWKGYGEQSEQLEKTQDYSSCRVRLTSCDLSRLPDLSRLSDGQLWQQSFFQS
jgi:hypothetical protein